MKQILFAILLMSCISLDVSAYVSATRVIDRIDDSAGNWKRIILSDTKTLEDPGPPPIRRAAVYVNRGTAYYELGLNDLATADFTEALRLRPDYPEALIDRGAAYIRKELYDQAITDCSEALRLKPDLAYAYNNRGFA